MAKFLNFNYLKKIVKNFKKIILITCLTASFAFARSLIAPVLSPYAKSIGFSNFQISIIFAIFSLTVIFASPIIGRISDSIGRKKVILAGLIMSGAAFILYLGIHLSSIFFIFARVLEAAGMIAVSLIAFSKLEDIIQNKKRGQITGFSESFNTIGWMFGPLAGGFLADYVNVQTPFFSALLLVLILFMSVLFWKEPKKRKLKTSDFNFFQTVKKFLSIKELRAVAFLGFFMHATSPIIYVFIPLFIVEELGKSYTFVGYFMFALFFFHLFKFIYGRISDVMGRTTIMILSTLMSGVLLFFFSFSYSFAILFLLTLAKSFADANSSFNMWVYMSTIGEKKKFEGQVTGSFASIARFGSLFSYGLCSLLVLYVNIRFLFVVYGAMIVLASLIAKVMLVKE